MESWEFGCGMKRFCCGIVTFWLWNRENVVVEARRLWLGNRVVWFWNRVVLVLEA